MGSPFRCLRIGCGGPLSIGGLVALVQSYFINNKKQDVLTVVNGILGSLVAITAGCAVLNTYSALFVGAVGSFLANISPPLLEWLRIDDAVGATCVHGFGGGLGHDRCGAVR